MTTRNWTPWFIADWQDAVFMHFRVDARKLRPIVPLELDTWDGDAIVSLVAFTQSHLRPARFGRLAGFLSAPLARHEFLNLRTYVRHGDDRGIFFLAEWIPNRLATLIGPRIYGLPYRLGRLRYQRDRGGGSVSGEVSARGNEINYRGVFDPSVPMRIPAPGSIQHFLIERYTAWTSMAGAHRRFRIEHEPWEFADVKIEIPEMSLLSEFEPWIGTPEPVCAQFSPGVRNVFIGSPERQILAANADPAELGRMPCLSGS